jgi:hypothetical protein
MIKKPDRHKAKDERIIRPKPIVLVQNEQSENRDKQ